ncbi:DUF3097 family protein [Actinomycetospora sp. NBRC 106375]|uniref:DUF3097 family protein n=1 Tax=Actinomycetospora sp. NBRC 106375 TaxID=3032207 RepID=UPI0025549DCC|nr:DUF3097 family protein [Actinomycetospora sp. NBRC 106375]
MAPHTPKREVVSVVAEPGLVVEDAAETFCGAVIRADVREVVLEDAAGRRRLFPNKPAAFLHEGRPATLVPPQRAAGPDETAHRSASGSRRVESVRARTALPHRIWVEGLHDAEIVERVWGHDLRVEGVVVEPLHGADVLVEAAQGFGPGPDRRLGVLVDHLVTGSKESRIAEGLRRDLGAASQHVLVLGHPYVDIWEAVKPRAVGIEAWPSVPRGIDWKRGVCEALGWGDERAGARRVLSSVSTWTDLETPLITAMEQLIDFVTVGA